MTDDPHARIRQRLGDIGDELRALPDDAFSAKHRLHLEADALRQQLAGLSADGAADTLDRWADRASRKSTHSVDDEVELAKAAIVSPGQGGGAAV